MFIYPLQGTRSRKKQNDERRDRHLTAKGVENDSHAEWGRGELENERAVKYGDGEPGKKGVIRGGGGVLDQETIPKETLGRPGLPIQKTSYPGKGGGSLPSKGLLDLATRTTKWSYVRAYRVTACRKRVMMD